MKNSYKIQFNNLQLSYKQIKDNIEYWYHLGNEYSLPDINCYSEASNWYKLANHFVKELSAISFPNLTIQQCAGIVAVLSPNLAWNRNKEETLAVINYKENSYLFNAYPPNVIKALYIRDYDNLEVIKGNKVIAFYHNLLLDDNYVTIDRHGLRIALNHNIDDKNLSRFYNLLSTKNRYQIISQAYKDVATKYGLLGYELQALIWVIYRQITGISYRY